MIKYGTNPIMEVKTTVEPLVPPVTILEMKNRLVVEDNQYDDYIERLIKMARIWAEKYTNLSFITQTKVAYWTDYTAMHELPYGPVQSISSVEINGSVSTNYYQGGLDFVTIYPGVTLNTNYNLIEKTLKVTYVAGYGDAAADVPDIIKIAIEKQVATAFENRRKYNEDLPSGLTNEAKALLDSVRRRSLL